MCWKIQAKKIHAEKIELLLYISNKVHVSRMKTAFKKKITFTKQVCILEMVNGMYVQTEKADIN